MLRHLNYLKKSYTKYKNTFIDKILYAESHVPVTLKTIINEIIEKVAKSKVKDYKSLTSKSLFKFMDLIDI